MELTEVVSPHVAVPVFGVLLCAFLVFAFGFKSPVQPPSFNFDEDSKKKKQKKSKQQKGQTNGHVLSDTSETPAQSKLQSSPKHGDKPSKSTLSGNKAPKKADAPSKKVKKLKEDAPASPTTTTTAKVVVEEEGWTTQVSRKDRKMRHKKEEKSDSGAEDKVMGSGEETEVKQQEVEETPQEQRPKGKNRKKSQKSEGAEVKEEVKGVPKAQDKQAASAEIPVETSAVVQQDTPSKKTKAKKTTMPEASKEEVETDTQAIAPVAKKPKAEASKSKSPSPDTTKPKTQDAKAVSQETAKQDSKSKSPAPDAKKSKPQDAKLTEDITKSKSSEASKAGAVKGKPVGADSKPAKSPKNKKKSEKETVLEPETKEAAEPAIASVGSQPCVQETSVTPTEAVLVSDKPDSGADGPSENCLPSPVVAFDELGQTDTWTEAKPKGKKKKPRREN